MENTLEKDLAVLNQYRQYINLAELRVDCLDANERLLLRRFPEMAGVPVILTVRRECDGGKYIGGEGHRITFLARGLAFAELDPRKNFAYIDIEEDVSVPGLEEAARSFGTRIIRSIHCLDTDCLQGDAESIALAFEKRMRALLRQGDEIPHLLMRPQNMNDCLVVYKVAEKIKDFDKIIDCSGFFGMNTRVLSDKLVSFVTYSSTHNAEELSPKQLVEDYRFGNLNKNTDIYALIGYPLRQSLTPAVINKGFSELGINAVYLPFPVVSLDNFFELSNELKIKAVSVTAPYKEKILPYLSEKSDAVQKVGACNTMLKTEEGWVGYNTDTMGFMDSISAFTGRKNLKGMKVTVLGAGGIARSVASCLYDMRARVLILNRSDIRAHKISRPYGFASAGLDSQGMELMERHRDLIIQCTSLGMNNEAEDALPDYNFTGKELVMDLIYTPKKTNFLKRAEEAGCKVSNGLSVLYAQAAHQFNIFTQADLPTHIKNDFFEK
jgi:3-dehydroquinate dehydratase/shikimate dehydrogenase